MRNKGIFPEGRSLINTNHEVVALARCNRYDPDEVCSGLESLFEQFGGLSELVKPGQKVLLKPNLLAAASPSEAVTTHPLIIKVLSMMLIQRGARVFVGDSPGSDRQEDALKKSGLSDAIRASGAEALIFSETEYKETRGFKKRLIPLAAELKQVDLMINVGKLKTHSLTGLTGAVKNTYGCITGRHKTRFHLEHPLPSDFSRLIIDVYLAVKPAFSILDAIVAMEGPGPRRGKPRQVGLLLASPNAIALDNIAAAITGFKAGQVTTLAAAQELQLPGADLAAIKTRGLSLEECRIKDFDRGPAASGNLGGLLTRFPSAWFRNLQERRRPFPYINNNLCSSCGICSEHCPAQIIEFTEAMPNIALEDCIRCYCCAEFCPQGAIELS